MSKETLLILSRINTIASIIIFFIFYLKKDLWRTQFKWVGILLIGSFCFDIIGQILYSNNLNANIAINSWKIFETMVGSILFFNFFKSKSIKSILLGTIVLFPIFSVVNLFFIQGTNESGREHV